MSLNIQDCINFWKDIFDLVSETSISSNLDDGEIEICDYDIIDIDNDDEILDDNETTDYM